MASGSTPEPAKRLQSSFVQWWVHRIASSERYNADPPRIRDRWSLGDIAEAHRSLDYWAEMAEYNAPDPDD